MFGTAGFIIAVGIVSSIIFMLSMRADRARDRRRAYANSSDTGGTASSIGGFSLTDWYSSSSSSPSSSDSCSSSSYFSSSDSSCSDAGGGGDGGGGGGGD